MRNKIIITKDFVEQAGLFSRKTAYSKYDWCTLRIVLGSQSCCMDCSFTILFITGKFVTPYGTENHLGRINRILFQCSTSTVSLQNVETQDNNVACRPAARQQLRKKQLYNSHYWVTASQTIIFSWQQLETATEEWCFLCGQLRVDSWINEVVVRRSPAGKKVNTEAEDIVGIRHQATTGDDIANWGGFICAVLTVIFGVCNSVRLT
jgi:hypothetical protein